MNQLKDIQQFIAQKHFAIVGVSRQKTKFGNLVFKEFKKKNLSVCAVNQHLDTFEGEKCHRSISELPSHVTAILISTSKNETKKLIEEAIAKGITNIWVQQGAENLDVIEFAKNSKANIIFKRCVLMFLFPKGIHQFHGMICKMFRVYPK